MERDSAPPSELREGKIEAKATHFTIRAEYDGSAYTFLLDVDAIEGPLTAGDRLWSSPVKFKRANGNSSVGISARVPGGMRIVFRRT